METADRKAILKGDICIWLKEKQKVLTENFEIGVVAKVYSKTIAIVEIKGKCYLSVSPMPWTIQGMLYETRDSFDELITQYPPKEEMKDNAGSNASIKGGVRPAG